MGKGPHPLLGDPKLYKEGKNVACIVKMCGVIEVNSAPFFNPVNTPVPPNNEKFAGHSTFSVEFDVSNV